MFALPIEGSGLKTARSVETRGVWENIIDNPEPVSDSSTYTTSNTTLTELVSHAFTSYPSYVNAMRVVVVGYVSSASDSATVEVEINGSVPTTLLYGSATTVTSSTASVTLLDFAVPVSTNTSYTVAAYAANSSTAYTTYITNVRVYQAISTTTSMTFSATMPPLAVGNQYLLSNIGLQLAVGIAYVYVGSTTSVAASFTNNLITSSTTYSASNTSSATPTTYDPTLIQIQKSVYPPSVPIGSSTQVIDVVVEPSGLTLIYQVFLFADPAFYVLPPADGAVVMYAFFKFPPDTPSTFLGGFYIGEYQFDQGVSSAIGANGTPTWTQGLYNASASNCTMPDPFNNYPFPQNNHSVCAYNVYLGAPKYPLQVQLSGRLTPVPVQIVYLGGE
jgi:hypothetical protein